MNTLDTRFSEMKNSHFSNKQIKAGYFIIWRIQKPSVYWKILWEIVTTFIAYSPSVNSYMPDIIASIRKRWNSLTNEEQDNIIAALSHLNKNGKIDNKLDEY